MLIKVQNETVVNARYSVNDLKRDNPNVSFPENIPESVLNSYDVYTAVQTERAALNSRNEKRTFTFEKRDNVWTKVWQTVLVDSDVAAKNNREYRNTLLSETDWWASSDLTMSDDRRLYRQQLRDITTHANWPYLNDDDWPTKPS